MRSLRFLASRRWALLALTVVLLAWATWWLGQWQFGRLEERQADNAVVRANESREPAPVRAVLAPGRPVATDDEWRLVRATGVYDPDQTVVVRYQTRDGAPGVDVVVPLTTADGTALLVDRGWLATQAQGRRPDDVPAPPDGEVTLTGWVRADGTGDSTAVDDLQTRAISSRAIGDALDREVYGGFVELRAEDPAPATPLRRVELPELDDGPHFFYGLQWWFFGVLAVFGFFYLVWDEWRGGPRRGRRRPAARAPVTAGPDGDDDPAHRAGVAPPSTGITAPDTYEAAGESRNAATRPSSAGSP